MAAQPGSFDLDEQYAALSAAGDPLQRLAAVLDFELFRVELDYALARSDRAKGGRPPYDAVPMFKVLVLQTLYPSSQVPDPGPVLLHALSRSGGPGAGAKAIWFFREQLTRAGAVERLFARFGQIEQELGWH